MLISYEEKLRIAQESLRQPSVNQIAEATGIHRSVVQKALNDPEIVELQETLKIHLRSRYVNDLSVSTSASREAKSNKVESDKTESNAKAGLNQLESSVSEEDELRIREVEALESIATSLVSLRSMFEGATKHKTPTQEELDEYKSARRKK